MWYKPPRGVYEAKAYQEGWNVRGAGGARHDRPINLTDIEREAFNKGHDDRAEAMLFDAFRERATKIIAERARQHAQGT